MMGDKKRCSNKDIKIMSDGGLKIPERTDRAYRHLFFSLIPLPLDIQTKGANHVQNHPGANRRVGPVNQGD